MLNTKTTTEKSDLRRLVSIAARAANSKTIDDVDQCIETMRYLKSLSLSAEDILGMYREVLPLESLRDHENQTIRMGANVLLDSWMKTLYSSRKQTSSPRNKAPPTKLLKKPSELVSKSKKKRFEGSRANAAVCENKQNSNKTDDCKSSESPCKSVPETSRPVKKQRSLNLSENDSPVLRKNEPEMLELFEIAKKSADVANAKGIVVAKKETSICVDTLSLLISFPISSTAPETRQIMQKLERLTKHKDRKICNSASALLHHWASEINNSKMTDSVTGESAEDKERKLV